MKHAVASGDVNDSLKVNYTGPFDTALDAVEWGERNLPESVTWWIVDIVDIRGAR